MEEKTEEPTHKKIEDARKKGQVAVSKDVTHALSLVLGLALVLGSASTWWSYLKAALAFTIERATSGAAFKALMPLLLEHVFFVLLPLLLLPVLLAMAANVLGTWIQSGPLFAPEAAAPSFKKLNVVNNVKQMFSGKQFFQLVSGVLKTVIITIVAAWVIYAHLNDIVHLPGTHLDGLVAATIELFLMLVFSTLAMFVAIAIVDFGVTWFYHRKELRMTKHEVQQEYKESEGDPHMKQQRKSLHKQFTAGGSLAAVRRSAAIITNPTHIAIGVAYQEGEDVLPWMVLKEVDAKAKQIRAIAKSEGIPIVRNVQLARAMFKTGNLFDAIPIECLNALAVVFVELGVITQKTVEVGDNPIKANNSK